MDEEELPATAPQVLTGEGNVGFGVLKTAGSHFAFWCCAADLRRLMDKMRLFPTH